MAVECQVLQRNSSGVFRTAMARQIRAMEERGAAKQGRGGAPMRNAKLRQSGAAYRGVME
jgi:hypothetical protein